MRYAGIGLAFAAIGFVVATTLISVLTILLWRVCRPWFRRPGPLFLIRMLPTFGAAAFVLGFVVPAFLCFEPRRTSETFGPGLVAVVILAGALMLGGVRRAVKSWLVTRRLERTWKSVAVPVACPGLPVPAYRVPSELPFAALVGCARPRLFVSDRFFDALSASERRAVLQHEAGHLLAFDNLKRALILLAPDWLSFSSTGREIEAAWAMAAERSADDHAAGLDGARSLDLAGALLKASRFVPTQFASITNFCDGATIAGRVARLLEDPPAGGGTARPRRSRVVWIPTLVGVAALIAFSAPPAVYGWTEWAVRLLR